MKKKLFIAIGIIIVSGGGTIGALSLTKGEDLKEPVHSQVAVDAPVDKKKEAISETLAEATTIEESPVSVSNIAEEPQTEANIVPAVQSYQDLWVTIFPKAQAITKSPYVQKKDGVIPDLILMNYDSNPSLYTPQNIDATIAKCVGYLNSLSSTAEVSEAIFFKKCEF